MKNGLEDKIYELETSLLTSAVRHSTAQLNKLISEDFVEFGSSGKVYTKRDLLSSLPKEIAQTFVIEDFKVMELSENVLLATYRVKIEGILSLRSSIWKQIEFEWQIVFHQGTPAHLEEI